MEIEHEHPGVMIRKRLELYGMSQTKLAAAMDMHQSDVSGLINGRKNVTPLIAVRLSGALDGTPYYWAELQMRHDVERAIREVAE